MDEWILNETSKITDPQKKNKTEINLIDSDDDYDADVMVHTQTHGESIIDEWHQDSEIKEEVTFSNTSSCSNQLNIEKQDFPRDYSTLES